VMFTDISRWGKFGQWGHLENMDQDPADSVKYSFLLDWFEEAGSMRHIDQPTGGVPQFDTVHNLPVAVYGEPYEEDIVVSGGEAPRTVEVISSHMLDGLSIDAVAGDADRLRVSGIPNAAGLSYAFARVLDTDGDPAWRTFTVRSVGGPDTILEVNLDATNPGQNLPWSNSYVLHPNLAWSGIDRGPGANMHPGDNAIVWSVAAPPEEADATLELAISDGEYLSFTIEPQPGHRIDLRGAEMRLTIRRIDYHAPRRYAVMASVSGFSPGEALFISERNAGTSDHEISFLLPVDSTYESLDYPVEFRIYGYSGQWGGHRTSMLALRLDGAVQSIESPGPLTESDSLAIE